MIIPSGRKILEVLLCTDIKEAGASQAVRSDGCAVFGFWSFCRFFGGSLMGKLKKKPAIDRRRSVEGFSGIIAADAKAADIPRNTGFTAPQPENDKLAVGSYRKFNWCAVWILSFSDWIYGAFERKEKQKEIGS